MRKKVLLQAHSDSLQVQETKEISAIDGETKEMEYDDIDCPRCHDIITLSSFDFDSYTTFVKNATFHYI
jgi:hypothetical protein